jgi:hypothetical protein
MMSGFTTIQCLARSWKVLHPQSKNRCLPAIQCGNATEKMSMSNFHCPAKIVWKQLLLLLLLLEWLHRSMAVSIRRLSFLADIFFRNIAGRWFNGHFDRRRGGVRVFAACEPHVKNRVFYCVEAGAFCEHPT